jgi:beta-lactamase superfamily II metal-dependent hydrolase
MKPIKLKIVSILLVAILIAIGFVLGGCELFASECADCLEPCPSCSANTVTIFPENFDGERVGLEVHYINVGQGHAALVKLDDGKTMLIDAGQGNHENAQNRQTFVSYLQQNLDKNYIDYLIITHSHADHINLLVGVFDAYTVNTIYKNLCVYDTATARNVRQRIAHKEAAGTEVFRIATAQTFNISGENYSINIFAPGLSPMSHSNNSSIFVTIEYNERRILFKGDAEGDAEQWFITAHSQQSNNTSFCLFKVAHHGSNSSTTEPFLNHFTLHYAVISVDQGSSHGHPHPSVMNRLFERGIVTYRTNRHGTIVALVDIDGNMAFRVTEQASVENNRFDKPNLMITSKPE